MSKRLDPSVNNTALQTRVVNTSLDHCACNVPVEPAAGSSLALSLLLHTPAETVSVCDTGLHTCLQTPCTNKAQYCM